MGDERRVDLELIFKHCVAITARLELDEVIERSLVAMREVFPRAQCVITQAGDDGLRVLASDPPVSDEAARTRFPYGNSLVGRVAEQRMAIRSADVHTDQRMRPEHGRWAPEDRSFLAVPLTAGAELVGTMHVLSTDVDAFSESDGVMLLALAPAVATAIRNASVIARQRESWRESLVLDARKARFMQEVAADIAEPLRQVEVTCDELAGADRKRSGPLSKRILEEIRGLAQRVEEAIVALGT